MKVKGVTIRFKQEMLDKLSYVADYEGRSVNSHVLVLVRDSIARFKEKKQKKTGYTFERSHNATRHAELKRIICI